LIGVNNECGRVLVVDDNRVNRIKLARLLERQGHDVAVAEDGHEALKKLHSQQFDILLLDIVMPGMDGYEVLAQMHANEELAAIPVIVISSIDEMQSVVKCIQMGAEDYLPKPFDAVLLRARLQASLEKKRLRDQQKMHLQELRVEREKSERLLLNILPRPIADRLKQRGGVIADSFESVTVMFADIADFTSLSAGMSPTRLVVLLNEIFSAFDQETARHGLEKIKTVGDEYMVVGGLPLPRPDHTEAVAQLALAIQARCRTFRTDEGKRIEFRIGINTGPVVAGVIGESKFCYDLWGDTVNIASRMTSHGKRNAIQVSESTYQALRDQFVLESRGPITLKGRGPMPAYLLRGRNPAEEAAE